MEIRNAKYTTQKGTLFYNGDSHQIKKKHVKKMPPKIVFFNQTFSLSFFPWTHSLTHIVSDSLSHIKSNLSITLSIFLMISYIFQWLIRSILQKLFNTFYVPIMSSKVQRCLSKWCQKKPNISQHIHFIHPVRWDICHICWVRNWHTFSFLLFFSTSLPSLHHFWSYQQQLPQLFLLHSENDHKTYPLKWKKWEKLLRIQIERVD